MCKRAELTVLTVFYSLGETCAEFGFVFFWMVESLDPIMSSLTIFSSRAALGLLVLKFAKLRSKLVSFPSHIFRPVEIGADLVIVRLVSIRAFFFLKVS